MYHACSTSHSTSHNGLVSILLTLHLHILVYSNGAQPVVRVILPCCRLRVNLNTGHTSQEFLIESLHMLMMLNVVIHHRHLSTTDTSTDI